MNRQVETMTDKIKTLWKTDGKTDKQIIDIEG